MRSYLSSNQIISAPAANFDIKVSNWERELSKEMEQDNTPSVRLTDVSDKFDEHKNFVFALVREFGQEGWLLTV